jgi:hypothetical protein
MRRRALLRSAAGLAAAGALAGCFMERPPTELRLIPADADLLADRFVAPREEFRSNRAHLVADLLDEGTAVGTESGDPALPDGLYVSDDGRYYAVATTFLDDVRTTGYDLVVRRPPEDRDTDEAPVETVAFEDLPETDREAFLAAEPADLDPGIGTSLFRSPTEFDPDASTVADADGPVAVTYEGTTYLVVYGGRETREDRRYRYDLEVVGDSRAALVEHLASRYLFDLDGGDLSADERDVVESAVVDDAESDGYTEEEPLSASYRAVLDLIADHDAPGRTHTDGGEWLCAYDGTRYVASIEWARELPERDDYRTATATDEPPSDPGTTPPTDDPTDAPSTTPGNGTTGTGGTTGPGGTTGTGG